MSENLVQVKVFQVHLSLALLHSFPMINCSHSTNCMSTLSLYEHSLLYGVYRKGWELNYAGIVKLAEVILGKNKKWLE